MRISLIMNKPAREQVIMNKVKSELEKEDPNCEVRIFSAEAPNYYQDVFKFKPNVLLTYPLTGIGLAQFYYLLKLLFKTKIILFRTEGVLNFESNDWMSKFAIECVIGHDRYSWKLVDKEIFWGEKLAHTVGQALLNQNKIKNMEDILIYGNPRYENLVNGNTLPLETDSSITNKIQSFSPEKTILTLTGFHMADYTIDDYYRAGDLDAKNNLENLVSLTKISKDLRTSYIKMITDLSQAFQDMLFIVKKHPLESPLLYQEAFQKYNNILFIKEDIDSQVFTSRSGLLIHYGSTVLMESYILKIPSIYATIPEAEKYYTSLGWPSSAECYVPNIINCIEAYRNKLLSPVDSLKANRILKDYFNIYIGNKYYPSQQIAKELLKPSRKSNRFELLLDFYCIYNLFGLTKRIIRKICKRLFPRKNT